MQAIHIAAANHFDMAPPEAVLLQGQKPTLNTDDANLDEALSVVLSAVRESRNPNAMDALGELLAYMESLEKRHTPRADNHLLLGNVVTLTL